MGPRVLRQYVLLPERGLLLDIRTGIPLVLPSMVEPPGVMYRNPYLETHRSCCRYPGAVARSFRAEPVCRRRRGRQSDRCLSDSNCPCLLSEFRSWLCPSPDRYPLLFTFKGLYLWRNDGTGFDPALVRGSGWTVPATAHDFRGRPSRWLARQRLPFPCCHLGVSGAGEVPAPSVE